MFCLGLLCQAFLFFLKKKHFIIINSHIKISQGLFKEDTQIFAQSQALCISGNFFRIAMVIPKLWTLRRVLQSLSITFHVVHFPFKIHVYIYLAAWSRACVCVWMHRSHSERAGLRGVNFCPLHAGYHNRTQVLILDDKHPSSLSRLTGPLSPHLHPSTLLLLDHCSRLTFQVLIPHFYPNHTARFLTLPMPSGVTLSRTAFLLPCTMQSLQLFNVLPASPPL